ncbi:MAG: 3-phosphoshikimate 1-carboxyvinyltransferase [Bacilli bacterium]|nr:3-phosphoshikimate 1-carboxyvinyltransferase [Bacilli bacterium]
MNVLLKKGVLNGVISAPPSKSYSHRYIIASLLSNDKCEVSSLFYSDDIEATLSCVEAFGGKYEKLNDKVIIHGNNNIINNPVFNCNESGSTLRFLIPIALSKYDNVTFVGTERLISRGIDIYEKIFISQNIKTFKTNTTINIQGKLKAGIFDVDGSVSSQYITGLLFALPLLDGDSVINIIPPINSKEYIEMTLDVLNKFNIKYERNNNSIKIFGNQKYIGIDSVIEGDYSNSAFLDAFNYMSCNVKINNLNPFSLQGDKIYTNYFKKLDKEYCELDISNCIDLGPVLFAFAALKHGGKFIGTSRLRIKESNRDLAMKNELAKVGVEVVVNDNDVIVKKSLLLKPTIPFDSHNDHRIVMALSLFLTQFDIQINNANAINKSYPHYFKDLEKLGVDVTYDTN